MANALYYNFPRVHQAGSRGDTLANLDLPLNMSTPVAALVIGSLLVPSAVTAGKYDAMVGGDASTAYQVTQLVDIYGNRVDNGYLTTTQLAATQYYARAPRPVGNVTWIGTEDAVGGAITAAQELYYADLIVGTSTALSESSKWPWSKAVANILIDSSSVNASAGSLRIQLLGPAPMGGNPVYSTTNKRSFLFTFLSPGASQ